MHMLVLAFCMASGILLKVQHAAEYDAQRITIGVYSPIGSGWRTEIQQASSDLLSYGLLQGPAQIDLVFWENEAKVTCSDIQEMTSWLRAQRVSAMIGPYCECCHLCAEDLAIPFLSLNGLPSRNDWSNESSPWLIHMKPPDSAVRTMVKDIVKKFEWKVAAVLYDSTTGLEVVGELMTIHDAVIHAWPVSRRFTREDNRDKLLYVRRLGIRNIILHTDSKVTENILAEALRLSMLSDRYSWIIVTLEPFKINLTPYNYIQVNLTTFQLVAQDHEVHRHDMRQALAADAVRMVAMAANNVFTYDYGSVIGEPLLHEMKQMSFKGLSGNVQLDDNNNRNNLSIQVYCLTEAGLIHVGMWHEQYGSYEERFEPEYDHARKHQSHMDIHPLGLETVRIVVVPEPPFVMIKSDHKNRSGNDRFEGFLVDLIDRIAINLDFEYKLYLSPDGNYGSKNEHGEWNGMIRELIAGNAEMCLGALSITSDREEAVDFTKPFMQKHFNILIKKPLEKTSAFQFLFPLSAKVWIFTSSALVVVGIILFVMDRLSPSFHGDSRQLDLRESMWFIYGSLVGVGTEVIPRTLSARLLSASWWFFSLILLSSYTANLAAFLTVTKIVTPIKSIADLSLQTNIKYGTVKNTYAESLFKSSKMEITRKMWAFMSTVYPDSMVDNSSVGIQKVKEGGYAFIWDAPINAYTTMHECDTMWVGDDFDEKGLGIGVPSGAAYRDDITMQILSLAEEGVVEHLQNKWWSGGVCEEFKETSTSRTKELNMDNVAGIFYVLAGGITLAIVVCICEILFRKISHACTDKNRCREPRTKDSDATIALKANYYNGGPSA